MLHAVLHAYGCVVIRFILRKCIQEHLVMLRFYAFMWYYDYKPLLNRNRLLYPL